jgi:hypothetical protein
MAKVEQELPDDFHVRLRRGGVGLREAHGRFERALDAQLIDHVAISAVEAAVWVRSLSELLERWNTHERRRFRERLVKEENGTDFILGLQLAADLGLHQIVADQNWGASPAIAQQTSLSVQTWRITWGCASPSDRKGASKRKAYDNAVLGHEVGETLRRAARLLDVMLVQRHRA